MALCILLHSMQVPDPAARRRVPFEPEALQHSIDRQDVVLDARLRAHDFAGFDEVGARADRDPRTAAEQEPVLVTVVE